MSKEPCTWAAFWLSGAISGISMRGIFEQAAIDHLWPMVALTAVCLLVFPWRAYAVTATPAGKGETG